jgi:general secretion pathway protein A
MYSRFFGLREDAFSLTPDPRFLFLSWRQRKALAGLTDAIVNRKRFILVTGNIGTGKSTLIASAQAYIPADRVRFSVIRHPTMKPAEVVEAALMGFGVSGGSDNKARLVATLERVADSSLAEGIVPALVIDDAQKLPPDALEEVRLLGNLNSLQIVLAGQNELNRILNQENMLALKERIAVHLTTEPLLPAEVRRYISHRWKKAGGPLPAPFDGAALEAIMKYSRGVPRRIHSICDNALMAAYTAKTVPVGEEHVIEAAKSLDLMDPPKNPQVRNRNGERAARRGMLGDLASLHWR